MADYKIGAKIVLDGEAEFRSAVNSSKASLKELDSELKLVSAQYAGNEKSMEALKAAQSVYAKQQQQLTKQEELYTKQLAKASSAYNEASKSHKKTADAVEDLKKELEKAKDAYGENSDEVKELTKQLDASEKQYAKEEVALNNLESKMSRYNTDLNNTKTSLALVDNELADVNDHLDNYDDYITDAAEASEKASPELNQLGVSFKDLVGAELIADGIKELAKAVVELAKSAIDVGSSFEHSMSNVEALSGAVGDDLTALTEKAKEMGAQTIYSATEAADALSYMALAGWDVEDMLYGIEPILNMAAAADMDLATASDIVTDYITAFGLEAKDAAHMADLMAYAMANSNTTVELLGESYKHVGATANSMGISIEEVTAALATMANAGVKGGEAGTALNTILTRLATNTKECADTLEDYGVSVYDAEGNMNSLSEILDGMAGFWDTLTDREQANLAKMIAGTNQYSKFQTIMLGVSEAAKEGGQSFGDYYEALVDCDGAAQKMADTMQDNLQGKVTILKSALEGLGISAYEVFDDTLKDAVDAATISVTTLNKSVTNGNLGVSLNKLSQSIGNFAGRAIDLAQNALPGFIDKLSWLLDNAGQIGSMVKIGASAWIAYEVAVKGASVAQKIMNGLIIENPIGALAAVIAACTVTVVDWAKSLDDVNYGVDETTQQSNRLYESIKATNEEIMRGVEERKQGFADLDNNAVVAGNLVDKLEALQVAYAGGADNMIEMKNVVDQLNTVMPELNLTIDEQTGSLNQSLDAIKGNIDALMKYQKVQAAQEDLNRIAEDQYELQKDLLELDKQIEDQKDAVAKAEARYAAEVEKSMSLQGENQTAIDTSLIAWQKEEDALLRLQEQQDATNDSIEALGEEYEWTYNYINDNSGLLDGATTGMNSNAEAIDKAKNSLALLEQAYSDAYVEAYESISGQIELFGELTGESDLTVAQMSANLASQAEVMNQYATDLQLAAALAEDGLLDKGLLGALQSLGLDGAGYLHELVTSAQTDEEAFATLMANWGGVEEAKANVAAQLADIETNYTESKKHIEDTIADLEESTGVSTDTMLTLWQKYGVDLSGEMSNQAKDAKTSGTEIGTETVAGTEEAIGWNGQRATEAYDLGQNYGQGYIDGVTDKMKDAKNAGKNLANATADGTAEAQDSHSHSRVAKKLGEYFGQGYAIGLEDSMTKANEVLAKTLPTQQNVKVSSQMLVQRKDSENVNQLVGLLKTFLPGMQNGDTNVQVTLEGDAKQIFKVVRNENRKSIKATGYNQLA